MTTEDYCSGRRSRTQGLTEFKCGLVISDREYHLLNRSSDFDLVHKSHHSLGHDAHRPNSNGNWSLELQYIDELTDIRCPQ